MDNVTFSRTAADIITRMADFDAREQFRDAVIKATAKGGFDSLPKKYKAWLEAGSPPAEYTAGGSTIGG